jgi:choline kinase
MLDAILEALAAGGFGAGDVVYIRGYKGDVIADRYPGLTYVRNDDWESNNILLSLLCARQELEDGFVSTYSDIVYRPEAVAALMRSPHDITLVCDTDWRRRYRDRSLHPESDGEKVRADGDRLTEISRRIPAEEASGEFIGLVRMTAAGAKTFLDAFDSVRATHRPGEYFREGRAVEKAYLIDLFQHMLEAGADLHWLPIHGGYMEIDTLEDAEHAEQWWRG